jgi:ribonuclease P/MRP protein subunit RPP40
LDDGKSFDCIYFDFSKAFDTVPHARLIKKLISYGIDGKMLSWVKSFLNNRKQRVVVNKDMSEWSEVTSGVPQGSVLGPTLFLIYINDIDDMIESTIRLFADDTKLFSSTEVPLDNDQIQRDTDRLSQWSDTWLLKFNTAKCSTLHYGIHNPNITYLLGEGPDKTEIPNNTQECDLGILFSTDLKFSENINKCINKANGMIGLVKRTFHHINTKQFRKLYKGLIRPHLEYGNLIWHPRFIKDIESIERVQKRATKLVHCVKHLPYPERLKVLKIPTLAYRRFRGDMIEVYKLLHGKEDIEYTKFFDLNPNTTRGHSLKLKKKSFKKDVRKHFFSQRVITPWNLLTDEIVTAPSLNTFKNRLDIFMKDQFYTVIPDRTWVPDHEGAIRG